MIDIHQLDPSASVVAPNAVVLPGVGYTAQREVTGSVLDHVPSLAG